MRCFMVVHLSGVRIGRRHLPTSCTKISPSPAVSLWAYLSCNSLCVFRKLLTMYCIVQVSLVGRQLINMLLNRDPRKRLGTKGGANEIKQHAFFRGINWPLIRDMVGLTNTYLLYISWCHTLVFCWLTYVEWLQDPPPLDVPLRIIEKDPKAKDIKWEDDGVLVNSMDIDIDLF